MSIPKTMYYGHLQPVNRDDNNKLKYFIASDTTIGSDRSSVDVWVKANNVASRQCRILPDPKTRTLHLEVLDGDQTTSIGSKRLNYGDRVKLKNGDVIAVSDHRFKISYLDQDKMKQTPGRGGLALNASSAQKKKRRSIFDSTPPVASKNASTLQQPETSNGQELGDDLPRTPVDQSLLRKSPRQPKSILSAKKNILVTRTPTMFAKVVRFSNTNCESPTSPAPSKTPKVSLTTRSPLLAMRKRAHGIIDEKIKKLAGLPPRRKEAFATSRKSDTSIADEVPETPEKSEASTTKSSATPAASSASAISLGKLGTLSTTTSSSRSPVVSSVLERHRISARASTSNVGSWKSEPMKSTPVTPKISKRFSEASTTSSSSSSSLRKTRTSFRVSPLATFSPALSAGSAAGQKKPKTSVASSSRSSISSTSSRKSRQSFRTSPLVGGPEVLSSTMAASPNTVNASTSVAPSDSFGSLSVSDVDFSVFDTLNNDKNDNSTLKVSRSSGDSTNRRSRVSRSPKTESVMEDDEVEESDEPAESAPVAAHSEADVASTVAQSAAEVAQSTSRRSSRVPVASSSKGQNTVESQSETNDDKPLVAPESLSQNSARPNQENTAPPKKTWAGVLKKSIASGSPFKSNQQKDHKLKLAVKSNVLKRLRKNQLQKTTEEEIFAAFASTGHALSPQTIFVDKRLTSLALAEKAAHKRDSSLLNKTHDIELETFVSPFSTPDNSEAMERVRAFVSELRSTQDSALSRSSSSGPGSSTPTPIAARRSTKNSQTSATHGSGEGSSGASAAERLFKKSPISPSDNVDDQPGTAASSSSTRGSFRRSANENSQSPAGAAANSAEKGPNGDSRRAKKISASPKQLRSPDSGGEFAGVSMPAASPRELRSLEGDLTGESKGLKETFATPKAPAESRNDWAGNLKGLRKMFRTPEIMAEEPQNDLDCDFEGVKKIFNTPKSLTSPKNELGANFSGVKRLLRTPKHVTSPKNELVGNFTGVKKLLKTPKDMTSPKNELDLNFSGVKNLLETPRETKLPENNLDCDYRGTKRLFRTPQPPEEKSRQSLNDSVLQAVSQLLHSTTPKRRTETPIGPQAKRRKFVPAEGTPKSPAASGAVAEALLRKEVSTRSPMASGRSKRRDRIEGLRSPVKDVEAESVAPQPERVEGELKSTRTSKATNRSKATKTAKTTSSVKQAKPAAGRTTKRTAKVEQPVKVKTEEAQVVEEVAAEAQEPVVPKKIGRRVNTRRGKPAEQAVEREVVDAGENQSETEEIGARRTRAKNVALPEVMKVRRRKTPKKVTIAEDVKEAEPKPPAREVSTRSSRKKGKPQADEEENRVKIDEVVEVKVEAESKKSSAKAGRPRKQKASPEIAPEASSTETSPAKATASATRGRRKAQTPKLGLETKSTTSKQKEKASKSAKRQVEDEALEAPRSTGRKQTTKTMKEPEGEEIVVVPLTPKKVAKSVKKAKAEGKAEPEAEAQPKSKGRKRKAEPIGSPAKRTATKRRAVIVETEKRIAARAGRRK